MAYAKNDVRADDVDEDRASNCRKTKKCNKRSEQTQHINYYKYKIYTRAFSTLDNNNVAITFSEFSSSPYDFYYTTWY